MAALTLLGLLLWGIGGVVVRQGSALLPQIPAFYRETLLPLAEETLETPVAARRTVPASNAFVPAACGLVCGSEVVKDLLRKAGVYRGQK